MVGIVKQFEKTDSSHIAEYGYSPTGLIHIWSNYKGTALCGRNIKDKLKYKKIKDKPICKTCYENNKKRYGLFDLAPTIFVTSFFASIITAIKRGS